jgi:hypothetical protein
MSRVFPFAITHSRLSAAEELARRCVEVASGVVEIRQSASRALTLPIGGLKPGHQYLELTPRYLDEQLAGVEVADISLDNERVVH